MILSCIAVGTFTTQAATTDAEVTASTGPQDSVQGSAILHCFNWSYNSIKDNLQSIKDAGYTAVQTSPAQSPKDYNASWKDQAGQWWKLYQPLNFKISDYTWLGTKADLKALCDAAEAMDIKVIVDVVANHVAGEGAGYGNINSGVDSALKNSAYYHSYGDGANDGSRYAMTMGHIGMPDLNTANSAVQNMVKNYLIECINVGVDGFRFDAAKHIELPTDTDGNSSQFWPTVINGSQSSTSNEIYYYGEILNGCATSITNYTQYMSITDNYSGDGILVAANSRNASGMANSNYSKGAAPNKNVLWVESHDTYMGESGSAGLSNTSYVSDSTIIKAWAMVGSRADASSLFFARPAANMGSASTNTTWKSTAVAEVNKFKNYFAGQTEYLSSSGSIAYNERGTSGVVLVNASGTSTSVNVTANKMAAGTYTDQITGNTFTVANGKITGNIGSTGVAVVYNATPAGPSASVTPGSKSYTTDTLTLTLKYSNATSGQYSIDGGAYTSFTNGQTISIGSGKAYGTTTTVSVKASDGSTTSDVETYTYTKKDPNEVQRVYFDNSSYKWSTVYAYIYVDENTQNAAWPGVAMTLDSSTGYYVIDVPAGLENGNVIFTENYSATTNRYPADGETGMQLSGSSMLFSAGHSWKEYTPVNPTTPVPTTTPTTPTTPTTNPVTQPTTVPTTTTPIPSNKVLVGDTNLSGNVSVSDATEIQMHIAEMIELTGDNVIAADVDQDGYVSIKDATAIQCYLVDLVDQAYFCGTYIGGGDDPTTEPTTKPTDPTPTTPIPSGSTIYFNANHWTEAGAWFAVYAWDGNGGETFVKMNNVSGSVYSADLGGSYNNVIFCRMDPAKTAVDWASAWNQTADLTVQSGCNKFTVNSGEWTGANGTWSTY